MTKKCCGSPSARLGHRPEGAPAAAASVAGSEETAGGVRVQGV